MSVFVIFLMKLSFHHVKLSLNHLVMLFRHHNIFGQLIFPNFMTIVAIRGWILPLKCTKFYFGWGSTPDPAGAAYSAPQTIIAGFKAPTSNSREEKGGKVKGSERNVM